MNDRIKETIDKKPITITLAIALVTIGTVIAFAFKAGAWYKDINLRVDEIDGIKQDVKEIRDFLFYKKLPKE